MARAVKRLAVVFVALAAGLLPALPAGADDRSLRQAGTSRDATFKRLGEVTRRTYRAWERSGHPRRLARKLLRLNRRTRREIVVVRRALQGFRSLRAFDTALVWDGRGVRAHMRGRRAAARRNWRRAGRHFDRSVQLTRRAVRAIKG